MFCQAGGISARMAWNTSMPPASSTSSMLSMLWLSLPFIVTSGEISSMSGRSAHWNFLARALAHMRLPEIVLISPLCAR